jgi:dynein heavy chain
MDCFSQVSEEIVGATLTVYKTVQEALLPTPTKSFYLFNLRDMARVVAGLTMLAPRSLGKEGARDAYLRAWVHELLRVFYDRLVDETDQGWFLDLLRTVLRDTFQVGDEPALSVSLIGT